MHLLTVNSILLHIQVRPGLVDGSTSDWVGLISVISEQSDY